MSRIEELIQELCPEGVEFKTLDNIAINFDSKRKPVAKGLRAAGKYPYYGASGIVDYVSDYIFDGDYLLVSEDGANLIARNTPIAFSISGKSWVNNHAHVLKFDNYATRRLVEIYLNSIDLAKYISGAAQPKLNQDNLNKIPIPIPPLPIQQEIVSILDKFTQLGAELEAELGERKKQYEYYRDQLLQADDEGMMSSGVKAEWKTLGEVCHKTENIKWSDKLNEDYQYIDLSSVNRDDNSIVETQSINSTNAPSRAQQIVNIDDVIFGTTRPTLKRYSIITSKYHNQICSTGFCVLRTNPEKLLSKYLFYTLMTNKFYNYVENNQKGASYPSIPNSVVNKFPIPIPPLTEQNRIVEILDKFDTLVNDTKVGLPAEIAARQKQYEYYRARLLDFKEKQRNG